MELNMIRLKIYEWQISSAAKSRDFFSRFNSLQLENFVPLTILTLF